MLGFLKERRRRRVRGRQFPEEWRRIVEQRFFAFRRLGEADRTELLGHAAVLLEEKRFEGCGGLELTDEVRVVIAAQAALLLLHREHDYFPGLFSILVYPDAYLVPVQHETDGGLVIEETLDHVGESWDSGTVILSWRDVLRGATGRDDGCNVVLHEFTHQVDAETGETDGVPDIQDPALLERWKATFEKEYDRLCVLADRGKRTWIDDYGATHPSEFFAVSTEHFFMEPVEFSRRHPGLYRVLAEFWGQDPRGWGKEG